MFKVPLACFGSWWLPSNNDPRVQAAECTLETPGFSFQVSTVVPSLRFSASGIVSHVLFVSSSRNTALHLRIHIRIRIRISWRMYRAGM